MTTNPVTIMSYNVCHLPEVQNQTEKLSWDKRKDRIYQIIDNENPDVICFQELFKDTEQHKLAFEKTWEKFKDKYEFVVHRSTPQPTWWDRLFGKKQPATTDQRTPYAVPPKPTWWQRLLGQKETGWHNVVAYKKNRFRHVDTEPPFKTTDNMVNQVVHLQPINQTGDDEPCEPFYIFNIHNGINHEENKRSNAALVKKVDEIINRSAGGHFFICGDFNSLELSPFHGFKDLSPSLQNQDGVPLSGTFVGYSYDPFVQNFYPEQKRGLGYLAAKIRVAVNWTLKALAAVAGKLRFERINRALLGLTNDPDRFKGKFNRHLDRCFYKHQGVENNTYEFKAHLNTLKGAEANEPRPQTEKEILAGRNGKTELDSREEFPSDHLPLIIKATKIVNP